MSIANVLLLFQCSPSNCKQHLTNISALPYIYTAKKLIFVYNRFRKSAVFTFLLTPNDLQIGSPMIYLPLKKVTKKITSLFWQTTCLYIFTQHIYL